MARNYNIKHPLVLSEIDGAYGLIKDPIDAIKQNLRFLVLTAPGERLRVPEFGVGIRNYLFENFTPSTNNAIESRIRQQAATYMPYITITSITFKNTEIDNSVLGVQINYTSNTTLPFTDFLVLNVSI